MRLLIVLCVFIPLLAGCNRQEKFDEIDAAIAAQHAELQGEAFDRHVALIKTNQRINEFDRWFKQREAELQRMNDELIALVERMKPCDCGPGCCCNEKCPCDHAKQAPNTEQEAEATLPEPPDPLRSCPPRPRLRWRR